MSALNNQTNINRSRYFFATSANGEQQLSLDFGTTGGSVNLSTMAVAISGDQGNSVIVNTAPQYLATEFMIAEDALVTGTNSTYFTMSTLNTTLTGVNITTDRTNGTGTGCIESYSGNGSSAGVEFLTRGVNSQLLSTNSVAINNYFSSIGNRGASARIQNTGILAGAVTASGLTSLDAQAGGGGRVCFGIQDLSGTNGVTPQARWGIGTSGVATGGNAGSDLTFYTYADAGTFLGAPMTIRRADGATAVGNISSIQTLTGATQVPVFPASKTNVEFGAPGNGSIAIAGASNQATPYVVLFSTPMTGLTPNTQTLLNINFINALSTSAQSVNYKVGFSTSTAYTNILQTSYVPGGGFAPSGIPSATAPQGATNICCMLDSDGINTDGTATLYVAGQLANPTATADLLYIKKGAVTEATRNALVWRPV